jgi:putative drug exporter of the RND superfamily
MSRLGGVLARVLIALRWGVAVAWAGGAIWMAITLPSADRAGAGSLGALVPKDAPALTAERISAQRFAFPLLSRTLVVVRNPHGLPARRQGELVSLAQRLSFGHVKGFGAIAGALPLLNTLGAAPFSREHGTTALLYLYFRPTVSARTRARIAERLVAHAIGRRPGEFEGVTGESAAHVTRTELIESHLKWVELATILLVIAAIAIHFRALGAAGVTIAAVAVAYVCADRLVGLLGKVLGISVPAEVQPLLVVLVFGVVTDYSVFFLSRFRALLASGRDARPAAIQATREIAPIVAVAGTTVAAGTAGLLAARLEFLRAFGPGLAIAVVIAMLVAATLVPALLAIGGWRVFWPRRPQPQDVRAGALRPKPEPTSRRTRAVRLAVKHPVLALVASCAIVLGAASGLLHITLGNELVLGLPGGSQVHRAYDEAKAGFAPGALAPAVVVVTGPSVGNRRPALDRFQDLLARHDDVAQVLGPRQQPIAHRFGVTVSSDGDAARYALFLSSDPLGARAISAIRDLSGQLPSLLRRSGLSGSEALIAGDSALSADTVDDTLRDLARVTPAALAAIFLVIALYLRALIAPAYLVLTSVLSAAASLGLTVYVVQSVLGSGQLTYYVVFTVAILLVSLGSDYNVFLVGRIWQEGRRRPLRDAVEVAGGRAARPITVAGLVLALSFALLAIVPIRSFREIAFAMAVGLLIDAFAVRTVLVPALLTIVGPRSAWPGHGLNRARGDRKADPPSRVTAADASSPSAPG